MIFRCRAMLSILRVNNMFSLVLSLFIRDIRVDSFPSHACLPLFAPQLIILLFEPSIGVLTLDLSRCCLDMLGTQQAVCVSWELTGRLSTFSESPCNESWQQKSGARMSALEGHRRSRINIRFVNPNAAFYTFFPCGYLRGCLQIRLTANST